MTKKRAKQALLETLAGMLRDTDPEDWASDVVALAGRKCFTDPSTEVSADDLSRVRDGMQELSDEFLRRAGR